MSDSDDTDILLLIPPDFFAVQISDSEDSIHDSQSDVVSTLITQVCDLETRLTLIESKENLTASQNNSLLCSIHREDTMSQQIWHNLNASTPQSRSSRAVSLPPTPSGSFLSGAPLFHRTNSYPSPPKSTLFHSERTSHYSKSVTSPSQQNGPSVINGDITSNVKPNKQVAQLSTGRETKSLGKSKNSEIIKEIDNFFSNLKGRYDGRSRDPSLAAPSETSTSAQINKLGLKEVDQLLEKVEADQQLTEAKLSARERQYGLPVGEEVAKATRIRSFPGDSIASVPDLNLGVRKLWDDRKSSQPSHTSVINGFRNDKPSEPDGGVIEEPCVQKRYSLLNKDAVEPKRRDSYVSNGYVKYVDENEGKQIPKVFASRRRLDLDCSSRPDISRLPETENKSMFDVSASDLEVLSLHGGPLTSLARPENSSTISEAPSYKSFDSAALCQPSHGGMGKTKNANKGSQDYAGISASLSTDPPPIPPLMSLADLWGEKKNSSSLSLEQRLEEEKCRREHCETLVHTLQTRLLEAHQRLAVAQRVDSEKDAAIKNLHSTWSKISDAWSGLEEERDVLAHNLQATQEAFQAEKDQLIQKLSKCEDELSKALDLAHGYKEQSAASERTRAEQFQQLGEKVQEVERRLASATKAQRDAEEREKELRDQLTKEAEEVAEFQKTVASLKNSLTQREADLSVLTEEKGALQTRLREERSRAETLQQSRDTVRREAEDAGKRERSLQAEVRQLTQQLSSIRSELRDFYQEQLERAVRDKLTEFQSQLDAAEAALHREAENREVALAELAARQLKQLNNKHNQEIALLEQRHSEELRLVKLQKTEAEQTILELRKHVEEHETNASNLAQRLHGIMQNQWREALSVVSGSKAHKGDSKAANQSEKTDFGGAGDGWDSIPGQSWLLVKQQEQESRRRQRQSKEQGGQNNYGSHPSGQRRWSGNSNSNDEVPFEQEGQLTQRSTSTTKGNPQASNSAGDSGEDLKKYIKMLLDRAPGKPIETLPGDGLQGGDSVKVGKTNEKVPNSGGRDSRNSGGKRPWK